ncbi:DNA primase C [Vibrio phage JSF12]|uniref:DNA primase C n=2 Tax=Jesfedecavirus TaxID=2560156 RepID=A0A2D0YLS9_9CAUD|nr:replication origin binding [Vibrio phage JSF10]YP_009794835.1 replication origin binding [Vibrio phage JSF12]ASV43429.1 DNA primase C [Vibrio phage JSF10]ASV43670.1 DNA primase C [Vibrio phage JSF12]
MLTFIEGIFKPYFSGSEYIAPASMEKVRLAKVFDSQGNSVDPIMPKFFNVVESVNPNALDQAFKLISDYQTNPEVALVRAAPVGAIRSIRRNAETFNCSVRSRIIHMDIDGIFEDRAPVSLKEQALICLEFLNELEPEIFPLEAGYIAKASGSSGIKKGIRLHMYMQNETAVSNAQLKYLAYRVNKKSMEKHGFEILDTSVYDKVHLMYTANPVFEDPLLDPYKDKERSIYVAGKSTLIPDIMPEYRGMASYTLKKEHFDFITDIEGFHSFPSEDFERRIDVLRNAKDNVFMRHSISVYCAALEQGVDINWLDAEVEKILDGYANRKRSSKIYISNAKQAALKIILARSLRKVDSDIRISSDPTHGTSLPITEQETNSAEADRFLKINSLPPEGAVTFIKASLGTGKTTTVQSWLKSGKFEGRFLAVTNTVSLVEGNAKKLESGCYNKLKDFTEFRDGQTHRMSTTIHSLHRFYDTIAQRGIDMLFIDECDAVMNDILFSDLIKERDKCIKTLKLILQEAKYVVLSDGDISSETIEAYARLCDPVKPVVIYKHERRMLEGARAIELIDENSVWAALQGSLDIGEKCLLVSDCSPDELNEKGIALRASTGRNIKEVHKNSSQDADIKEILMYGNAALIGQNIQGLLCSPSVTSGVDFNYFDSVFILTRDSGIHAPNLRFQALRRDRGAKNIYYFTSPMTEGFRAGADKYDETLGWASRCRRIFARRRENECQKYRSTFRMLLVDQGCKISIDPSPWGKIESAASVYKEERINAILSATPSFSLQRHNDAWEIKTFITKYFDDVDDIGDITANHVEMWLELKPHDRAKFFHRVFKDYWKILKQCTHSFEPFVKELKENPNKWYQCTGMDVRTEKWRIAKNLKAMGIDVKHPGKFDTIISWYRTYCQIEGIQIPKEFMTESELFLAGDKDALF